MTKLHVELQYDPANPILGLYPREIKTETGRGVLFNLKKEVDSDTCYNMDEL